MEKGWRKGTFIWKEGTPSRKRKSSPGGLSIIVKRAKVSLKGKSVFVGLKGGEIILRVGKKNNNNAYRKRRKGH